MDSPARDQAGDGQGGVSALDAPISQGQAPAQAGWPIATGVIEGACRHLIGNRLDITGARWSLHGAEAVLKLRALHTNGDFPAYWRCHLTQQHRRVHQARYQHPLARAA